MTFGQAIASGFKKYSKFHGRSTRSEYWWWVLFTTLVGFGLGLVRQILGPQTGGGIGLQIVAAIFNLGTLVPSICVTARRLHDTGRSAYWMLLSITVIGLIPLIIWYATPGKPGKNQYGRNPLDPAIEDVF